MRVAKEGGDGTPTGVPTDLGSPDVRPTSLRSLSAIVLTLGLLAAPVAAGAHPQSGQPFDYVPRDVGDVPVITDAADVDIVRQSDNTEFVAHVPVAPTSDMQFQRRVGPQRLKGEVVDGTRDILVMGGTQRPGLATFDITDPTAPELLATVSCGGFHSDVAVYENLAVQVWDGSNRPCEADDPANRNGVESPLNASSAGVRVFDITDPADPVLVARYGAADGLPNGVHNVTINGDAGLAYLNMAERTRSTRCGGTSTSRTRTSR